MKFVFLYLACIFAILACSCEGKHKYSGKTQHTYQGIDVSHHQGNIDWGKVATDKNIKFVYVKATEGKSYVDSKYEKNIDGARAEGLLVGSYHFLRNTSPVKKQFEHFSQTVDIRKQDLIPMVDVEERVDKKDIALFCKLIEKWCGKKPVIYGTNRSYNSFCAPDFNDHILLIGRYGKKKPVILGLGHYDIWQYSEKGKVPGIQKSVDLDRFHPDFKLEKLKL